MHTAVQLAAPTTVFTSLAGIQALTALPLNSEGIQRWTELYSALYAQAVGKGPTLHGLKLPTTKTHNTNLYSPLQ